MEKALTRAKRQNRQTALLCLDLDRFKAVNDTLGHPAGDQLLIEVAHHLRKCARKGDVVARMGGDVVSFEALLRWRHPRHGMVSPGDFIPVAEDCGLIGPLGEWVLKTACATAASWPEAWRIGVNISPLQFRYKSLTALVQTALAESRLDPRRLELQITETVILSNETHNAAILTDIRALGVRIAMDDFGTGYSSLSYLRAFPFDKIKIDQSFVRDLPHYRNALSIIRAITDMAQSLDVKITAEGVETQEQLDALRALGCHEAQGYLIGRPAPLIAAYCAAGMAVAACA